MCHRPCRCGGAAPRSLRIPAALRRGSIGLWGGGVGSVKCWSVSTSVQFGMISRSGISQTFNRDPSSDAVLKRSQVLTCYLRSWNDSVRGKCSVLLLGAVSTFTRRASLVVKTSPRSRLGLVLRKDNIFLDTAGIGTGFTLVDYVIINGDQSACVSDFCAIIAFLWRFVDREHIRREKEPQNRISPLPTTDLMVFQRGNFILSV